jgi:hypothetical protein
MADVVVERTPRRGRAWSWSALVVGVLIWIAALPTFGFSLVLCPLSALLTGIARARSQHDLVFWIGLVINAQLALVLAAYGIGVLTGDVGVGLD